MTTTAETEQALLTALGSIAEHWDALMAPTSPGSISGAPTPKRLYVHEDTDERADDLPAIDRRIALRHEVTLTLNSWVRVIIEERNLTHHLPLGTDTLGLIEFMQRWARWFSGHEAGQDAADELAAWAGRVRATATPQRRDWTSLGTCPLEVEADGLPLGVCGGQVRAYPKRDPQCRRCGTEAVWSWWERVMFPDAELSELVTAEELIPYLRRAFGGEAVKASTIRKWQERGYFDKTGSDDKGRTLYNRRHVIKAMGERHAASG